MGRSTLKAQADFGGHIALRTLAEFHVYPLVRHQFGNCGFAQGFHVDKHVRLAFTFRNKTKASGPVKPFYLARTQPVDATTVL